MKTAKTIKFLAGYFKLSMVSEWYGSYLFFAGDYKPQFPHLFQVFSPVILKVNF